MRRGGSTSFWRKNSKVAVKSWKWSVVNLGYFPWIRWNCVVENAPTILGIFSPSTILDVTHILLVRTHFSSICFCYLAFVGYCHAQNPFGQHDLIIGCLLLMFALVPSHSTEPPKKWIHYLRRHWSIHSFNLSRIFVKNTLFICRQLSRVSNIFHKIFLMKTSSKS